MKLALIIAIATCCSNALASSPEEIGRALDERLPIGESLGKIAGQACSVIAATNVGPDGQKIESASVQVLTDLDRASGTFRKSVDVELIFSGESLRERVTGSVGAKAIDAKMGELEIRLTEQDQGRVEVLAHDASATAKCVVER